MPVAYIKAVSHYLPEPVLSNEILSEQFPEWSVDKIAEKTGIYNRHITPPEMFSSDMGVAAAEKLFKDYNISPDSIDFILFCTQSPDYFLPTTACLIQDRLNIPTSAGALDFNLGCSGYIYGLSLAKGLIYAGIAKNILLITAETYSKFIHPQDKSNRTIFGDAAAATVISAESGVATIGEFDLGTDGKGAENLIVKRGGMRYQKSEGTPVVFDEYGNAGHDNYLYMNGPEIFNFTSAMVPKLVNNVLKKNNLENADVSTYIFHQANQFMLHHLRRKLKIAEENFYIYMHDCGNTVCSTIPIALEEAIRTNVIKSGSKVVLAGFGVGYSWGGCVLNFV